MLDWPADAAVLADHLRLTRFGVVGYSGGTAYALALAYALADRVTNIGVVACVAHLRPGLTEGLDPGGPRVQQMTREHPWLARALLVATMAWPARAVAARLASMLSRRMPGPDQVVAATGAFGSRFPEVLRQAFREGARGPQHDMALMGVALGVRPRGGPGPCHHLAGTRGLLRGPHLQAALPHSRLVLTADGHLSVLATRLAEVLGVVTSPRQGLPRSCRDRMERTEGARRRASRPGAGSARGADRV